jgi:SAM-dependent methyltransferase
MQPLQDWTGIWERHLDGYLAAPPRAGIAISQMLKGDFETVLEIACGSGRDSLFLARSGKAVTATDHNQEVISRLRGLFPHEPMIDFRVDSADALSFQKQQFDISFHNGFFGYFHDNTVIQSLLREQCRVTRKHVLFFVHNARNHNLETRFNVLSCHDPLYDLRFFTSEELLAIVKASSVNYLKIRIGKFGGPADILLSRKLRGVANPLCHLAQGQLNTLYALTPLSFAEKLVCQISF